MKITRKISIYLACLVLCTGVSSQLDIKASSKANIGSPWLQKHVERSLSVALLNTVCLLVLSCFSDIPLTEPLNFSFTSYNDFANIEHEEAIGGEVPLYTDTAFSEHNRRLLEVQEERLTYNNASWKVGDGTQSLVVKPIERGELFRSDPVDGNHTYVVELDLEENQYYNVFAALNLFRKGEVKPSYVVYEEFIYTDPFEQRYRRLGLEEEKVDQSLSTKEIADMIDVSNPQHRMAVAALLEQVGTVIEIQRNKSISRLEGIIFQLRGKKPLYDIIQKERRRRLSQEEQWIADEDNHKKLTDIQMGVCSIPFCDGGNLGDYANGFRYAIFRSFIIFSLSIVVYFFFIPFSEYLFIGCSICRQKCCKVICFSYCNMFLAIILMCISSLLGCERGNCCFPPAIWLDGKDPKACDCKRNPCSMIFCCGFCTFNIVKYIGEKDDFPRWIRFAVPEKFEAYQSKTSMEQDGMYSIEMGRSGDMMERDVVVEQKEVKVKEKRKEKDQYVGVNIDEEGARIISLSCSLPKIAFVDL